MSVQVRDSDGNWQTPCGLSPIDSTPTQNSANAVQSGGTYTALQGKVNTSDIANNLTTTDSGKVLDARQGKALNDSLSGKVNTSDVANNLTTTTAGKVLDARQGYALSTALTTVESVIAPVEDGVNYSTTYEKNTRFIRGGKLYKVTATTVNSSTAINTGTGGNATEVPTVTNGMLIPSTLSITKGTNVSGTANVLVNEVIVQLDLEISPVSGSTIAANGETLISGLPAPANSTLYTSLTTISGQVIPCIIGSAGNLKTYYANEAWTSGRVDASIVYIATRKSV